MITEDFVPFEIALLLKEKGFDGECRARYDSNGVLHYEKYPIEASGAEIHNSILCPTIQMACKWLREVHHHIIEIHYGNVGSPWEPEIQWWWTLENEQGEFLDGNIVDGNTTYEKTCNAAVKFCLENLI